MQENLNVGSMIHSNQESADNGIIEKYCYNNDSSNCTVYGGLYQWNEMMDYNPSDNKNPGTTQGICPEGWHVPSKAEWTELIDFIGGDSIAGGKLKETGTEHWLSPNAGANNESGFTALGAGYRGQNKEFYNIKMVLGYWYSTEWNSEMAWFAPIDFDDSEAKAGFYYKELGHSVRCIKNEHILIKKSDISCFGNRDGSIDLIVIYGEGPYEFLWSTGDTIEDLDSLSAGMYYVEVTDKNDSIVIDSIEIMEPESLATNVEIHNEISCYGSNDGALIVKTSGGTLPYLIQWEDHNASHDSVAWNLSADSIYHVIVSDRNNCTAIDSGFLNQPLKIITSEISGKSEVFAKEQSDYYVTETLGSVYNWTVVGGSIISSKDSSHITIEWDEQGNGSVTVIETDTNGCKGDTISLVVTIGSDNNDSFKDTILVCHQWWPLPGFNCSEAHNRIKFNSEDLSYVKIDTGINSGWEIGKTVKFNSSFHNLNVICTGLTISYSVNTETTVEFKLIGNYYGGAILVGFDHVINTDLGMDGGCIEILLPDSTRWIGLHEIGIEEFTRDIYSINDTVESLNAPGFSGLIEERDLIEFAILANGLCDFNLCKIRFRFASDSIDSMKDGWLINDIWFYSPYESVEDFRGRYVQIYPNPFNHSTSIQFPNKSMDSYDLVIIDVSGNICQIINDISTSEYILEKGNLAPGLYFIELRGPKNYRSKIIIE